MKVHVLTWPGAPSDPAKRLATLRSAVAAEIATGATPREARRRVAMATFAGGRASVAAAVERAAATLPGLMQDRFARRCEMPADPARVAWLHQHAGHIVRLCCDILLTADDGSYTLRSSARGATITLDRATLEWVAEPCGSRGSNLSDLLVWRFDLPRHEAEAMAAAHVEAGSAA